MTSPVCMPALCTLRFESTAKVLAECNLKSYRISECCPPPMPVSVPTTTSVCACCSNSRQGGLGWHGAYTHTCRDYTDMGESTFLYVCREVMWEENEDGRPVVSGVRLTTAGRERIAKADAYVAALDVPGAKRLIPEVVTHSPRPPLPPIFIAVWLFLMCLHFHTC